MRGIAALLLVGASLALPSAATADHSSFSGALSDGTPIATVPSCNGIGPVGVLPANGKLYVSDACNNTLYRFPANGGAPEASNANGINAGLAVVGGKFYGIANQASLGADHGVYEFDPVTLERKALFARMPGDERGIATDPRSQDMYVTSSYGQGSAIFKVQRTAGSPRITTFHKVGSQLAGLRWRLDGSLLMAVTNTPFSHVYGFTRTGHMAWDLSDCCHGPAGVAPFREGGYGGDALVNANDGTIEHMKPNSGLINDREIVASGGTRGDQGAVDGSGCFLVTQLSSVERLAPCVFEPMCTVTGTDGPETLTGTPTDDVICAGGGNDTVLGGGGNDVLLGDGGNDTLDGGEGHDELRGGEGDDKLLGRAGEDRLDGQQGSDQLDPGLGADHLTGGSGPDDTAYYGSRTAPVTLKLNSCCTGGNGEASEGDLFSSDIESATGGSGDDTITSTPHSSQNSTWQPGRLDGGGGNDTINGSQFTETLIGRGGNDKLYGNGSNSGSDKLLGDAGDDRLEGGAGFALLDGGVNADHLCRCSPDTSGSAVVVYEGRTANVSISADDDVGDDGEAGEGDTVASDVLEIRSGGGNDTIVGGPLTRDIFGGGGDDHITATRSFGATLRGNAGADTLHTRNGFPSDVLYCGDGTDTRITDPSGDTSYDCEIAG